MKVFSYIISWFKGDRPAAAGRSDEPSIDDVSSIFFHEDDYCQIELVARENEDFLIAEGAEIQRSAKKNFDSLGFKDIHVIGQKPVPLSSKSIPLSQIADVLLDSGFLRIGTVFTGYSTHREHLQNAVAFKLDPYVVYLDHKQGIVDHIWLQLHWGASPESKKHVIDALDRIGQKWKLLLSHWSWARIVDLTDRATIENYVTVYPQ